MRENHAGGPVSIQVLSVAVEIATATGAQTMGPGKTLVLASDVGHTVTAQNDAVLLLTIAWNGQ